jgi:cell volume regulation protein A
VALEAIILAIVAVAIARPLAAFAATAFERFTAGERLILGWAGMRGAVPVVLATFPVIEGVPHSQDFFNIAFFAVLLSTIVQGATIEPLARRLRMTTSTPALPRLLGESGQVQGMGAEVMEFPVARGDAIAGMHVRDLGLPREALVNVIVRGGRAIPPRGSTRVSAGDVLHVMVTRSASGEMYPLLERWRSGPMQTHAAREDEVWMTMPVLRARQPGDGDDE